MKNKGKKMRLLLTICLLLTFTSSPALADSQTASEALETNIELLFNVVKDPKYVPENMHEIRNTKLIEEMGNILDFTSFARGALGSNWRRFNKKEQEEFTLVFSQLISRSYLQKMSGEDLNKISIEYLDSQDLKATRSGTKRTDVKTTLLYQDVKTNIDYRMFNRDNRWKVYDIKIEGISMIANYREQYRQKYKETPHELIKEIKDKLTKIQE